jgi:hypothetical protein
MACHKGLTIKISNPDSEISLEQFLSFFPKNEALGKIKQFCFSRYRCGDSYCAVFYGIREDEEQDDPVDNATIEYPDKDIADKFFRPLIDMLKMSGYSVHGNDDRTGWPVVKEQFSSDILDALRVVLLACKKE